MDARDGTRMRRNHAQAATLISILHFPHHLNLADSYHNTAGRYYQRSPVMQAHKVSTATLNICGP